jgi:protein-disulfide isomerase
VVAVVVLVVGGGLGFQAWRTYRSPSAVTPPVAITDAPQTLVDGQPIRLGADSAPAKIALYEDFHCPHCADFEEELGPTLTAAQNAGTAQIDLYPMSFIDPGSTAAANAMACATEAGFGQRYYLGLFANHTLQWSDAQLVDLAGKVGASAGGDFETCVTSRAQQGWVDSINAAAERNGVTGTPTMFLNGAAVPVKGLTVAKLQGMIDSAAAAAPKAK